MCEDLLQKPARRAFYKYATPATTLAVLKSRTVRYSSPLAFNDPFDIQSGLHFEFDLNSLHSKVLDRIQELASGPEEPPVDSGDVWGKIVLAARKYYPQHGFPRDQWKQITDASFRELLMVIEQTRSNYKQHWRERLLPGIRVFCVTEERDNLLMWAHYARDHTGVVFEYWSLPEEDNPLSVARQVKYVNSPPPFFKEKEWLDDFMGIKKLDERALYAQYAYIKSNHWSYEREWRVWYPMSDTTQMFDTMPIRPSEFKAIYLGCRIDETTKQDVLRLLAKGFPKTRVFQAQKAEDAYELTYTEI
jgi:hypothetical protein